MNNYRLRIEAVNLGHFVNDCKNLSAIRGGGLILLDASRLLKSLAGMTAVTSGASMAILDFQSDDPQKVHTAVVDELNSTEPFRFATFAVDIIPRNDTKFPSDREKLVARNRYRQMRSPSVAYPSLESTGPCQLDGVRPAAVRREIKKKEISISESINARREYGIRQRQAIFSRVNDPSVLPDRFTDDLDQLSNDTSKGSLHGKIAVIHVDGDKFGRLQRQHCTSTPTQQTFDKTVQDGRTGWLREHLRATSRNRDWLNGSAYRMEILQWGGDEIILVVPAWLGWATLTSYFQHSMSWPKFSQQTLTHSAGIAFCNHKASIHGMVSLAKKLTEYDAKRDGVPPNSFAYQILESFDTLGADYDDGRNRLLPSGALRKQLCLPASRMPEISKWMTVFRRVLPRHKLHDLSGNLLNPNPSPQDYKALLEKDIPEASQKEWASLKAALGGEPVCFLHIQELWDYVR